MYVYTYVYDFYVSDIFWLFYHSEQILKGLVSSRVWDVEKSIVPAFSWSSHSAEVVPSLVRLIRCWGLGSLARPASYIPSMAHQKDTKDPWFDLWSSASISPMSSSFATCTWAVWRLDVKWCLNCLEWAILGDKIYADRIWVNHVNLNDEPHTRNDLTSQVMWIFS